MSVSLDDTIAALASAPGGGCRGIIRISGPDVLQALDDLLDADFPDLLNRPPSRAVRVPGMCRLSSCAAPLPIDVYLWPNRRSYTGQPMAELHTIGSPPLLEAVLSELYACGVRPARPGEFTLRAFLAGRVDLVQAEAVLGVIDAEDHEELELALRQLAGGLSGRIASLRHDLLDLLADLEAGLDFVEEDIEFVERSDLIERLGMAADGLDRLHRQASERMQSTGRLRIVLAGLPNAGKSTLFNALAGESAALVSDVEGTTRDYLRAPVDWDGLSVELVDTAGWEESTADIMQHAQRLRDEQVAEADFVVWCTASDLAGPLREADDRLFDGLLREREAVLRILTKSDKYVPADSAGCNTIPISAASGAGLVELREAIGARLSEGRRGSRHLLGMTAARCRESLSRAVSSLQQAREAALTGAGDELLAVELRDALDHLGRILGAVYTDDILDRIFSKFCIGK